MLSAGDDFPIHQSADPVALVADRNFYDRFFFNGYSADGSLFFAAAMGIYPALDIIDAAFCVTLNGVQHVLRASAPMDGERMRMAVGPIAIVIDQPLQAVTIHISDNDGRLRGAIQFNGRHFPIEEPRFTRRIGTRLFMDYTRMTQNGRWAGWIEVDGQRIDVSDMPGTRDRSWGVRPIGSGDSQPPAMAPQFFWTWTPCNFDGLSLYFHSNDDGDGRPWNRRAVIARDGASDCIEFDAPQFRIDWQAGTRRVRQMVVDLDGETRLTLTPRGVPQSHFYMSGLGYTHATWGHGMAHGTGDLAHDGIAIGAIDDGDFAHRHIQALADAVLTIGTDSHMGVGVVEQMFIGPHRASGLTGIYDPAA